MANISGFGSQIQVYASGTFPLGFNLTQFADDADPFDTPVLQIADKSMGLNGDLILWAKANPIIMTLSVIPQSNDDTNLQILFESNRPGRGKLNVQDIIIMSVTYPNGQLVTFNNGGITDGMPANSVASAGRLKSKTYSFAFENLTVS